MFAVSVKYFGWWFGAVLLNVSKRSDSLKFHVWFCLSNNVSIPIVSLAGQRHKQLLSMMLEWVSFASMWSFRGGQYVEVLSTGNLSQSCINLITLFTTASCSEL